MGSGMGMPSIGYSFLTLFKFYDVENIIRIGSAGAYTDKLNLYDVVIAKNCWRIKNYAKTMGLWPPVIRLTKKGFAKLNNRRVPSNNIPIQKDNSPLRCYTS